MLRAESGQVRAVQAACIFAALVSAGCGSASRPHSGSPSPAPPASTSAVALPSTASGSAEPDVPRCSTGSLVLKMVQGVSGMTGEHAFMIQLVNRGLRGCSLTGYPAVRFITKTGTVVPFTTTNGTGYVTHKKPTVVEMRPGDSAFLAIAKYRCDTGDRLLATTALITAPGQTHAVPARLAAFATFGYCGPHDPGSVVDVSPFAASEGHLFAEPG